MSTWIKGRSRLAVISCMSQVCRLQLMCTLVRFGGLNHEAPGSERTMNIRVA